MGDPRPTPAPVDWAEGLFTVGVTGTNGKTSTVHMIAAILGATGEPALSVSTVGYELSGERLSLPRSARGFLDAMHQLRRRGGRWAAVECTSKALAEGYARRWRFDLGVFTNLSPDHLATHGSWEHYLASKAQLFTQLGPGRSAVLNAADPRSLLLDQVIPTDVRRRWYGSTSRGELHHEAELVAEGVSVTAEGTELWLRPSPSADRLERRLRTRMVGKVFAENALAAATAGLAADASPEEIRDGLSRCPPVPGRFEVIERDPVVVLDYAHTSDALARTCDTARELAGEGRVLVVFGAGGGRAAADRIAMGEAVGSRADLAFVTNDNPRDEDPELIAGELVEGLRRGGRARVARQLDRRQAIEDAMLAARPDDVVVIAGKGHETGQTIRGQVVPFSDRDEVRRVVGR